MVTIITSLYKSEKYLPEFTKNLKGFAEEVLSRGLGYEHIIIANAPSIQEREAFNGFYGKPWFKFVAIDRESVYATWNRGVGLALGDRIGFWNVDDKRYPEALSESEELFSKGAELIYFPFIIKRYLKIFGKYFLVHKQTINKVTPEFNDQTKPRFLREMHCGPFFMFTKTLYNKVGPFDEQFKTSGDFDWCTRAVLAGGRLVKSQSLAGEFRLDGGGLSAGGSMRQIVENNLVYRRTKALDKLRPEDSIMAAQYHTESILFQGKIIKFN